MGDDSIKINGSKVYEAIIYRALWCGVDGHLHAAEYLEGAARNGLLDLEDSERWRLIEKAELLRQYKHPREILVND